ncbi:MAG: AAA family ATPase [Chitinophagales bacterium]
MMQKLPIGESDFQSIIENNRLYVDKTQQIYGVITGSKPNFFSRPRRFGKSLLVSIMEHIFKGDKELFKNLWIYDKIDWKPRPVIRLSLTEIDYKNEDLETVLSKYMDLIAKRHNLTLDTDTPYTSKAKFTKLIEALSIEQKIVVLIDEYDKPIIDYIDDERQAGKNRDILKNMYGVLKDGIVEKHLHFLFVTGVSKFSKTSIFSELNNLDDLTLDPSTVDICGITQAELESYFEPYIQNVSANLGLTSKSLLKELKRWYNGYSWDGKTFVYNPFSLLNFFKKGEFSNFWFASGTPTLLLKFIKRQKVNLEHIDKVKLSSHSFDKFTIKNIDFNHLLFQTGYLTVRQKTYRKGRPTYILKYPNQEVEESFLLNLIEFRSHQVASVVDQAILYIKDALYENDMESFIEQLKILFSDIAYQLHPKHNKKEPTDEDEAKLFKAWEGYFHSIVYLLIKLLGLQVDAEMSKHKGRIDAKIEVEDYLYIMEFKLDTKPQKAIEQIKEQKYMEAFKNTSKQIILVGISFDSKECNVKDWTMEVVE